MKNTSIVLTLLCTVGFMTSCDKEKKEVDGWKPIYASESGTNEVTVSDSEPLNNPGRIYVYENYLMVNDQGKGIHIYDNSDQSNPQELSFIGIQGNLDFSVKDNVIYADNITDMVIVDISNPMQPEYVNRIENIFPVQQFPDEFGPFECVDASRGMVVGWERAKLLDPKCSR